MDATPAQPTACAPELSYLNRSAEDLDGFLDGGEIVGRDQDSGWMAMSGDRDGFVCAFDFRDVLGQLIASRAKRYRTHPVCVARTAG